MRKLVTVEVDIEDSSIDESSSSVRVDALRDALMRPERIASIVVTDPPGGRKKHTCAECGAEVDCA